MKTYHSSWRQEVTIPAGPVSLRGDLALVENPRGVVIFAHGSGSNRRSPRNRCVARSLRFASFSTLLIDLLSSAEQLASNKSNSLMFDIPMLAQRIQDAIRWSCRQPAIMQLPIGLFGASTGAAAAVSAAVSSSKIMAIVSRGGRVDLAGEHLERLIVPSLFIVGEKDVEIASLNSIAIEQIGSEHALLAQVAGATHLFTEEGAMCEVARLASSWFTLYLSSGRPAQNIVSPIS